MQKDLYVFLDEDKNSLTYGKWSVRDGMSSYDGFDTEKDAKDFMNSLTTK